MAELVGRDQNTDSGGQPLPMGSQVPPKRKIEQRMDTVPVGGLQLGCSVLRSAPEGQLRDPQGADKPRELRRKTSVLGFKTRQEFLSGDLTTRLFYVSNDQIPTSASRTQPWPRWNRSLPERGSDTTLAGRVLDRSSFLYAVSCPPSGTLRQRTPWPRLPLGPRSKAHHAF